MPSFITHYYSGQLLQQLLDQPQLHTVTHHSSAFEIGLQGHDSLFYVFGKLRGYGAIAHKEKLKECAQAIGDFVRDNPHKKEYTAFAYGYLSHLALDAVMHPYVTYKCEQIKHLLPEHLQKSSHYLLEGGIDYLVAYTLMNMEEGFKPYSILPKDKEAQVSFADIYFNVVDKFYDREISYSKLKVAVRRFRQYQYVFDHEKSIMFKGLMFLSKQCKYPQYVNGFVRPKCVNEQADWFNLNRLPFPITVDSDILSTETVPELIERGVKLSHEMINAFDGYVENHTPMDDTLFAVNASGYKI